MASCSGGHARAPSTDSGAARDGADASARSASAERCNGLDDDEDSAIDEGCPLEITGRGGSCVALQLLGGEVFCMHVSSTSGSAPLRQLRATPLSDPHRTRVLYTFQTDGTYVPAARFEMTERYVLYDARNGAYDYRLLDWHRGTEVAVDRGMHWSADLNDRFAVFAFDTQNDAQDLLFYDIESRSFSTRARPGAQRTVAIDGDLIGWLENASRGDAEFDEFWYARLPSFLPRFVTRVRRGEFSDHDGRTPAIRGHEIAYRDGCAIDVLDVVTEVAERVAEGDALCSAVPVDVGARFVVLEAHEDILLIDRRTRQVRAVTTYDRDSRSARLEGDWLAWRDDRNGEWQAFAMNLRDYDDGDFFPEGQSR